MLEIRLLGQFRIRSDGHPVEIPSRPAQSLLAYLAITEGVAHRREKLAGLLWPDIPETDARRNLRMALWQVRKATGGKGPVHADEFTIVFTKNTDTWVDVQALTQRVEGEWSIEQLSQAASTYGGELLPGFYDEWIIIERESLQAVFENRLKLLIERLIETKRWDEVREWGERWMAKAGASELAYRALMLAYAGQGDLVGVGHTYQRCTEALQRDLGVEPSEETTLLYKQLSQNRSVHSLSVEFQPNGKDYQKAASISWDETRSPAPIERSKSSVEEDSIEQEPPFKGLHFFDVADAGLFFGREASVQQLLERLGLSGDGHETASKMLFVVGASGSGKSSLVRAGLVPAVRHLAKPAHRTSWEICVITPSSHPLEALATRLTHDIESVTVAATLMDDMQSEPRSLRLFLHKLPAPLFLVVDQMEELFTLCHEQSERQAFVDNLLAAADSDSCKIVLALRADFYAHCARFDNLRSVLADNQVYIGSMNAVELRRAIEEPAFLNGYTFEAGLVDLILRDIGNEPGSLPLLSHALLETWKRRQGNMLTLNGYAEAGSVHGAIAHTADSVYARLTPQQRQITRKIFLRLTELGEGLQDTRRRASLTELVPHTGEHTAVNEVLYLLAQARLITIGENSVEVAHEVLIREWPTLRQWLAEDREGLRQHHRLTEAAQDWQELECEPGELYRGARLVQALEWASEHADDLNGFEREFLFASQHASEMETLEHEAAQQREIEAVTRALEAEQHRAEEQVESNRHLRWMVAGLVGILFLALLLSGFVLLQREQIRAQASLATSRELAAFALTNIPIDPERSILLALQALKTDITPEALDALHRSLQASRLVRIFKAQNPRVVRLVASVDGKLAATSIGLDSEMVTEVWDNESGERLFETPGALAAASWPVASTLATVAPGDGDTTRLTFWDLKTFKPNSTLALDYRLSDSIYQDFSPDWKLAAIAMNDGTVRIYSLATGQLFQTIGEAGGPPSQAVTFSPDGKNLIVNVDNVTQIWDLSTGQSRLTLPSIDYGAYDAQYSPKKDRVAVALGPVIDIADVQTGKNLLTLYDRTGNNYGIGFSWDGTRIAAGGADGRAIVWNAYTGQELMSLSGHQSWVEDVTFIPFRDQLATGGDDGTVRLWDISTSGNREAAAFNGEWSYSSITFSPDGRQMAMSGGSNSGDVIDANTGQRLLTLRANHYGSWVGSIAFSPDGTRLASTSGENDAYLWDATSGQELFTLSGHSNWIGDLAFSPDGKRLATIGYDGLVKLWDPASGTELLSLQAFTDTVKTIWNLGIDFSPDGSRFATAGGAHPKIWDAQTGKLIMALPAQKGAVYCIAFSPDGKRLGLGGLGGFASVWDIATGQKISDLTGHLGSVQAILFSRDGKQVITGSTEGTIKIWDTGSGQEQLTLTHQATPITGLALSPDGKRLAASSFDGTMHVYLLDVNDLIQLAKQRLSRPFTQQECRDFLHMETCPLS